MIRASRRNRLVDQAGRIAEVGHDETNDTRQTICESGIERPGDCGRLDAQFGESEQQIPSDESVRAVYDDRSLTARFTHDRVLRQ